MSENIKKILVKLDKFRKNHISHELPCDWLSQIYEAINYGVIQPYDFSIIMKFLSTYNTEDSHIHMDEFMCSVLESLDYEDGVKIFKTIGKWYA